MKPDTSSRGQERAARLLKTVAFVIGSMLIFVAVAMASAALVSVIYAEYVTATRIAASGLITAGFGFGMRRLVKRPNAHIP